MRGVTLTLNFDSSAEAVSYLNMLSSKIKYPGLYGEVKGRKLKLFIPESERTEQVINEVKTLYREMRSSKNAFSRRRFKVQTILTLAKLKTAIPIPALIDVVNLQGRYAKLVGDSIETSLDLNELVKLAEQLSSVYRSTLYMPLTPSARRLLTVASAASGKPPEDMLELLVSAMLLKREGEGLTLAVEYTKSLERLREVLPASNDG
jgi:hypothetical protein